LADIFTEEPLIITAPVVFPAVNVERAVDAKVVLPLDVKPVNAPVDARSVPIAVPLIPVAVVLKLFEVIVRSLPVDKAIVEALSPDKESVPDVPEILKAFADIFTLPLATVNPLDAVKRLDALIVPLAPSVVILPEVVAFPFSSMVKEGTPSD